MPSDPNRVYVTSEKEAPEDAIIRESENGNLYYCPTNRGRNNHTGGNKENELLDTSQEDLKSKGPRVYVESVEQAPDHVVVRKDDSGRIFYRQNEVWDEARAFYPDNVEGTETTDADGAGDGVESEAMEDQAREDHAEEAREEFGKGRVYVQSPEEAPENADVQEGGQGGYYYETGGGASEGGRW